MRRERMMIASVKQHNVGIEKKRNQRKLMKEQPEREKKTSQRSGKNRISRSESSTPLAAPEVYCNM